MKKEPALVIMAAGMGSRFGGLKQITPVTDQNEIIIDFSLYDAMLAGFKKVIFIIKEENEDAFRELMKNKEGKLDIQYAFQKADDLPEGYTVPEGREKPWGTAHAVLAARDLIDGPFAVINADDYYGHEAFTTIYDYLISAEDDDKYRFCMVGYELAKTITENGHVTRGVCETDQTGYLETVTERMKIMRIGDRICYAADGSEKPDAEIITDENNEKWVSLHEKDTVSMNFWGFSKAIIKEMKDNMPAFLDNAMKNDPLKAEYLLPSLVDQLIHERKATVKVLKTSDKWCGVTYKEDRESVVNELQSLKDKGLYPEKLWK